MDDYIQNIIESDQVIFEMENIRPVTQADKQKTFEIAFSKYWEQLYRHAYRKTHSVDAAKDLVQETFICIWDNLDKLIEQDKLLNYLYVVLRNKIFKLYEKDEVRLRYAYMESSKPEPVEPSAHCLLLGKELEYIIAEEIEKMPTRMKEIYILKKENQFSIKEIAEELSISTQTVKNQLHNALTRLRLRLKDYDYPSAIIFIICSAVIIK
jgi:RNA polymerase sigma-70 factor (ECF subfamily)